MVLITVEQAREHLRIGTNSEYEKDLALKMEQATAHVITYVKRTANSDGTEWTVDTDPSEDLEFAIVQGAILEVLANIFYDRGDRENPSDGPITSRIKNSLSTLRDPAMA